MAKAKKDEPAVGESKSIRTAVLEIVQKIGPGADLEGVIGTLKSSYPRLSYSESTVRQYLSFAKGELGFSKKRNMGARSGSSSEPTLSDLKNAQTVAEGLGLSPEKTLELIAKLTAFGDVDTLRKCLNALIDLAG